MPSLIPSPTEAGNRWAHHQAILVGQDALQAQCLQAVAASQCLSQHHAGKAHHGQAAIPVLRLGRPVEAEEVVGKGLLAGEAPAHR